MPAMRFFMSASLALLTMALPVLASAAESGEATPTEANAPADRLGPLAPDAERLTHLFTSLQKEPSTERARSLANEIREIQSSSRSATIDMLMGNADKAIQDKQYGAAFDFLDQVTLIAPDYAEGWNKRATTHLLMGNFAKAMIDLAKALSIEPRHLGALTSLATILKQNGRDAEALQALESYLAIYPADRDAQKKALDLSDSLAGQKI